MDEIKIKVNAKINLLLDIVDRYPDGYHKLDMLMTSVGIFDEIYAKKGESVVTMDGEICAEENTAVKALKLLEASYGISMSVTIKKGIPQGAGLGGSSADASGVFYCASRLFDISLSALEPLALEVGSDVPYMLYGGCARVQGRGEKITFLKPMNINMIIAQKKIGASTRDVYRGYDKKVARIANVNDSIVKVYAKKKGFANVLQWSAIELCPSIQQTLDIMSKYGEAFMTGSGSAVVLVCDDKVQTKACMSELADCQFVSECQTRRCGIEEI